VTARTVVVAGGTDGIGASVARTLLSRGDRVVVIGRSAEKGRALAAEGATFLRADLGLLAESRRTVEELAERFPVIDGLVLCARYYRSTRTETPEGLEENLALLYLSRFLFSHGLAGPLARAGRPVVLNVAGPGGPLSAVHWDDLGLAHGYHGGAALGQGGKLNDLLGVSFAERYATTGIRYVLIHPGLTAGSFAGEYDAETLAHVESLKRVGKPVAEAAAPIVAALDDPPAEPLSAFVEGVRIAVDDEGFDREAARRLHTLTESLLGSRKPFQSF
jgi:NAD(P)-dependent dehydrogenase (short-subunit alcohol dehydrogenase family)